MILSRFFVEYAAFSRFGITVDLLIAAGPQVSD